MTISITADCRWLRTASQSRFFGYPRTRLRRRTKARRIIVAERLVKVDKEKAMGQCGVNCFN